jgi:hypothetical protein
MVSQAEAIEVIKNTIQRDQRVPDTISYVINEMDGDGKHANLDMPFIQFEILDSSRDDEHNTTRLKPVYDTDGSEVGQIYETKWEMDLQMTIWTVEFSDSDADSLGELLKTVLFDYDSRGPNETFVTDGGEPVPDIWHFQLNEATRADDTGFDYTVRRFRQMATVYGAEQYRQDGFDAIEETSENVQTT